MTYYSSRGIIMSDIQELEAKLVQSQKKLNDLQYEVNAIHMELVKLKAENPQPQAAHHHKLHGLESLFWRHRLP